MKMTDLDFEFQAPQFIESLENAVNIEDGADHFFDAVESIETKSNLEFEKSTIPQELKTTKEAINISGIESELNKKNEENDILLMDSKPRNTEEEDNILSTDSKQVNTGAQENGNFSAMSENCEDTHRRLSLKRKASPLKDRNEYILPKFNQGSIHKFKKKRALQILPTVPESPVLLTKARVKLKPAPEPEKREILKPIRKKNIGVCIKPLPKPPTIPEPFNLTEPGKNVHHCYEDDSEKSLSLFTPNKKPIKKKKIEVTAAQSNLQSRIHSGSEVSSHKKARMNRDQCEEKKGSIHKEKLMEFKTEKMQELEDNLFIFKAHSAPKDNSSFISTASSSKRNFFDTSMVSTISTSSKASDMPFSFYERDKELLQRKKERMNQVDTIKHEFKAKEPSVLKKEPFWPEYESRIIQVDSAPDLATNKRAEERKILNEEKKKKRAIEEKIVKEELKKFHEEEIRRIRKTMEFKATAIRKCIKK